MPFFVVECVPSADCSVTQPSFPPPPQGLQLPLTHSDDCMNDSMVSLELVCKMAALDPDEFRIIFDKYGCDWDGCGDLRQLLYRHFIREGETINCIRHRLHDWGIRNLLGFITNSLTTRPSLTQQAASLTHPLLTPPPSPAALMEVIYAMAARCPREFLAAFDKYGCKWDGHGDLRQLFYSHLNSRGETVRLITRRCKGWGLRTLLRFLCMQQYSCTE